VNSLDGKYRPYPPIALPGRTWPDRVIAHPPIWCSVDLRDGNQALIQPLGIDAKVEFFSLLVGIGFKEIEIGFPAASETEYAFVRRLIEENRIPDDVTVQVLVQAREHLIHKTFEALAGVKRAIVHLYNSTSSVQRRVVFRKDRKEIIDIAVEGARLVQQSAAALADTDVLFQYSPESFTGTELDFAVQICEAVADVWQPSRERKIIINLPATVELSTPNIYADQIEWFCRNFDYRDASIISIHTHNDRGTGIAAAEFGLMAGGERIEGTLFGNGERTGNADIVTLALNMFSQGVAPGLDLANLPQIARIVARNNQIPIGARHPYAGDLVFTAFSGSHQDAIRKGLAARRVERAPLWEVPYLPIDPADIGRHYEPVVRINSQSGKGGVAYILEDHCGYQIPRDLQIEFSQIVQEICDETGKELTPSEIGEVFRAAYMPDEPFRLGNHETRCDVVNETTSLTCVIRQGDASREISGNGTGPLSALVNALREAFGFQLSVLDYHEHAIGEGQDACAISYAQCSVDGKPPRYGIGIHRSTEVATLISVISSVNLSIQGSDEAGEVERPRRIRQIEEQNNGAG